MQTFNTILAERFSKDKKDKKRWERIVTEVYKGSPEKLGFDTSEYANADLEQLSFAYGQLSNPRFDQNRGKLLNKDTILAAKETALSLYREMLRRKKRNIMALQGAAYIYYKFAIASFTPKENDQTTQELKEKFREERYESALKAERIYLKLLEYMPNNITANYRYAHMVQTNFWPYAKEHKLSYVQMFHLVDSYYIKTMEAYEALTAPEKQSQYAAKYAKTLFSRAKLYQDSVYDNYADVFTEYIQNPDKAVPGYTVKGMVQHSQTAQTYLFQVMKFLKLDLSTYDVTEEAKRWNLNKHPVKYDFLFNRIAKTYAFQYRYQCFRFGRMQANRELLESALYYALLAIQYDLWYNKINHANRNVLTTTYVELKRIAGLDDSAPEILAAQKKIKNYLMIPRRV